jgi:DNA ligase-1
MDNLSMPLESLVRVSAAVTACESRLGKVALIAELLAGSDPRDAALAATYLTGEIPQGRFGVGPALVDAVRERPAAGVPQLTLAALDRTLSSLAAVAGAGAQAQRRTLLDALFAQATQAEQRFLGPLLLGELRQGADAGLVMEAVARAAAVAPRQVRRAWMLSGDTGRVARLALEQGGCGLDAVGLRLFRPILPMLAQSAHDLDDALARIRDPYLELKLDGARVQVHKAGDEVRVYTRQGHEITTAVPEVVELVGTFPASDAVLDGEVLALRPDGRPHPFQVSMRRFGRRSAVEQQRVELPLSVFFFDCIQRDGMPLIDRPARVRLAALAEIVPDCARVARAQPQGLPEARAFLDQALALGHEGIMAKDPDAAYEAGARGRQWLKIKPSHTLDLVILGAEWGTGRRARWLSNLHLGARDPDGGFVMLGKTFKGLTDETLAWQTTRLGALAIGQEGHLVHVRPELVAEIAFDAVQHSPRYPAGLTLRFARLKRYRLDKTADQADSIESVRALSQRQGADG